MVNPLKVYEIFLTVNGEAGSVPQGSWTVFVRLSKCPLRCSYCDTPWTWGEGQGFDMTVPEIVQKVIELSKGTLNVVVTGGEPLVQQESLCGPDGLFNALKAEGFIISVETCGALDIPKGVPVSCWILDYKLPSSGEEHHMLPLNWFAHQLSGTNNVLKFVICDMVDYERAKEITKEICELSKKEVCRIHQDQIAFSPVQDRFSPETLFNMMFEDGLMHVRFNLQIHALGNLKESSHSFKGHK